MKKIIFYFFVFLLTACSSQIASEVKKEVNYNPKSEARIRLFGQNNYSTIIYTDGTRIQVGGIRAKTFTGTLSEIFSPLKSISIGIPKTDLIEKLAKSRSSIIAGLYYEEYVIPANRVYKVGTNYRDGGIGPVQISCDVNGGFYVQNNFDYEILADITSNKCVIQVLKIIQDNGKIKHEIVPLK
ncbi:hypothetical protein BKK54_05690 [Rodentibacter genomosp. 1]|uniref:Lipoprotein n=1 Tax=Rodentibacter genomosp. 1 TaxID=1908264 RepID=A0A1V3J6M7_9PAST|nr:membrane lipoprotein lipid attachment site-containing protein [Rodentibacter genomosp. 1]OOF50577.1 hypothetical protein BKK54_05690 [Rodentibacter genomosp. 1]